MRWLMALLRYGRSKFMDDRVTRLEKRGQLAVDAANAVALKAHRIALAEDRVEREQQQYADRLHDRGGA